MSLRTWKGISVASIMIAGLVAASATAAITVDGNLSDWGISISDNNVHDYSVFSPTIGLVNSFEEDQDDTAGHSFLLGPNYGGQDYDAELLAVAYQNNTLYIGLSTGQRPDNGFAYFGPGDIRIETSGGTYWLEVGGGPGGGSGSLITAGAVGSTYTLNSNGETQSYSDAALLQVAGSVWKDVTTILDPIVPQGPTQFAINGGSTLAGTASYAYSRNSLTTQHAFIEAGLDVSMFNGEMIQSVHWRPACGNDEVDVTVNIVPEPITMLLLAGGLVFFPNRRKRVV